MRSLLLAGALLFGTASIAHSDDSVVTTTIQWGAPHALDVAYVEKMPKETHTVVVTIRQARTEQTRTLKASVRGALSQEQVVQILNVIYSNDEGFWDKRFRGRKYWNKAELTGDAHITRVQTSTGADYAYGGITYWVSLEQGGVRLLYTSDSWFF